MKQELGSRFLYDCAAFLIRIHCLWLVHCILYVCVFLYTLLPAIRKRSAAYRAHRFPGCSYPASFLHTWRLHANLAHVLLDRLCLGVQDKSPVGSLSLRSAKGGIVVLSAHVGAWQNGLSLLASERNVHVVQKRDDGLGDRQYFERGGGFPFSVIDIQDPIFCALAVTKALQDGDCVCIMGDRLPPGEDVPRSLRVPFLGGHIRLSISPYAIAARSHAELWILFSARNEEKIEIATFERVFLPETDLRNPETYRPSVLQYAQALERYVARYPYQFFNFYDMWEKETA
ncbi:MAG: hypothetical protein IJU76_14015 [Desulfovibrionaceae bacterium]|nr:hypothetical protein [Desulfovibrionaceae bacterium]